MAKPNQQKQILKDPLTLIWEKRLEGYRPILIMDANGDDNFAEEIDHDLRKFIEDAHLVDHFHENFLSPRGRTREEGRD